MFKDATSPEIDQVLNTAWQAFHQYRKYSLKDRAHFMRTIAAELENAGDELIQTAMQETNLPEARLRGERARTMFQLTSYADACERGEWLEARIDTANPGKTPPKPDIRKMLIPLGPVVVFGASNFPFAYSTAGGDTACALAAGCPVIVKAHPAHAQTSELVAQAILKAATQCHMPNGVFAHVHGASQEVGKALVTHAHTKAVGFTGSYLGGKALFDWANQRKEPIPVFSEMGSVNPVFLFPEKMKQSAVEVARMYAGSITLGVGQFCTNPGLIFGIEGPDLQQFIDTLGNEIKTVNPGTMLHPGIAKNYVENRNKALSQKQVQTIAESNTQPAANQGVPTIASATGEAFLNNPVLHQEVFGPYSLVIRCKDMNELLEVVRHLEGQLTATLMATDNDIVHNEELVEAVKNICGRFIVNGVPTGVEVCLSMHHGGPFPATTDSRFTSVGADGIKRFARPMAFQNWSDSLLPEELKNGNPLGIWRTVNDVLTKDKI
ncbi:aldehyde dehydrogenase [Niastella koreensis]|uniref:Aldehyde dehydrogenase (NADP(+)) n=2 Tax=Niastella koreensis TaxID=354356 RepID=G8TPT3_NIAKG|nr:aldehyde dehydrogenase (NADP(+)) [Niastella koreensis]AEV98916.1 Aldehyde dehydrogenase (NADP(+)) [Niastella koreensis GR20-10]OQP43841.1 aldehyde dehydrogenase [Niastella koreensis]